MKEKIYYWHDPLNDDFANTNINKVDVPANYKYTSRNPFYLFFESLLRLLAYPIIYLIIKLGCHWHLKNKKVLKKVKGQGYFIYANHTNLLMDAYAPSVMCFPRKAHIIANADAVSIKGIRTLVKMLGAIPLPGSIKGIKGFKNAINDLTSHKRIIAIYPEAHIWPYYTDIRPFGTQSFHYPVDSNLASFVVTNVYIKRKHFKKPKVYAYVDGPFYPDTSLPRQEQISKLRDEVYDTMKKRVDEHPQYEYVKYQYVDDESCVGIKYF